MNNCACWRDTASRQKESQTFTLQYATFSGKYDRQDDAVYIWRLTCHIYYCYQFAEPEKDCANSTAAAALQSMTRDERAKALADFKYLQPIQER